MQLFRPIAQEFAGDLLAVVAGVAVQAREDAAAGDDLAAAWLRGELEEPPASVYHGTHLPLPAPAALAPPPDPHPADVPPWALAVLDGVRAGLSVSAAAERAQIARNTVYRWARRAPDFEAALGYAQATARARRAIHVRRAVAAD